MSQNEKYAAIIGIASDIARVVSVWEAFRQLFADYADEVIEALAPIAEAFSNPFGISDLSLSTEKLEDLFKQVEESCVTSTGTSPKEYGMSLQKRHFKATMRYNYIPRIPRNLPYQRRAY